MKKSLLLFLSIILVLLVLFFVAGKSENSSNTSDCSARMVVDNQYFSIASKEIDNARKSIDMIMFELVYYPGKHGPSNKLIDKLIKAEKRGVRVRIVMEGGEKYLGARFVRKVRRTADFLKISGISVKRDGGGRTTHAKLLIIDTTDVLIGSTNWSYYSLTKNRETNVLIKSRPFARDFTRYFDKVWEKGIPFN